MKPKLHGAIAAAATPLLEGGTRLDEDGVGRLVRFLAEAGIDGVLTCGTTGEGVLLSVQERMRVTELALEERPPGFQVAVHAGAQTSADTLALAAHAQESGADAVAVIAPPYFPLDSDELFHHFLGAASACEPLPFYVYEFAGRSGYAIPPEVVTCLQNEAPNLAGMKVSDTPFDAVKPYMLDGLDVFIGSEPLVLEGLDNGAVGAVSGLATAWPEVVSGLVRARDPAAHARVVQLRDGLAGIPFHAALKHVLVERGILMYEDVRPPLRPLTEQERAKVRSL
jgi:dihydrodipicolinate synthase/N-acetylneuraminate lyase